MKPQKHGSFHQKHSLGQNFIEDEALLSQLAELSLVTAEDCVLEIGPGFGALTKLMRELPQAKSIAVMIQKEVGDKLLSGPGDDGYGPLAVMCQYRYHVMRALDVPAACFNPPPKVDSSFMVLEKLEQLSVNAGDEEIFTRLVRSAFAMRRKTLLNNLVSGFSFNREQAAACLAAANLSAQARAEELSLEDFAGLAIQLQNTIR